MNLSLKPRIALCTALAAVAAALFAPAAASAFEPVSSFGSLGPAAGEIATPGGIAIGPDGSAYVADRFNARIDVFSPQGTFLRAIGKGVNAADGSGVCTTASGCQSGDSSSVAGALRKPVDVGVAPSGNLFVVLGEVGRIDVFSPQGTFLFGFGNGVNSADGSDLCTQQSGCKQGVADGSPGALGEPSGLAFGLDGNVYVASGFQNRIDVFSPQGSFLFAFGKAVNPKDQSDVCTAQSGCRNGLTEAVAGTVAGAKDVAVDSAGRILIANRGVGRVDVFSSQGGFLFAFGKDVSAASTGDVCTAISGCKAGAEGSAAGMLEQPIVLDVDSAGNVYVGDEGNARVSQFGPSGAFVRAFGEGVRTAAEAFEICDLASGCLSGRDNGTVPGSVTVPRGIAIDCHGAVYVAEDTGKANRVERFAERGTPAPPCATNNAPPAPSNRFKFLRLKLNKKRGTAILAIGVPGPGRLVLVGKGLRRVTKSARKAGRVLLPIRPAGRAKRKLSAVGRAKVRARVTFTPVGGNRLTRAKVLTLKKTRRR
jgi:hypothetical protein